MKTFYRILRFTLVSLLVLPLAVPAILYVLISLPSVQREAARLARSELTDLLGTPVDVGSVDIVPFNRIVFTDVTVLDPSLDPISGPTALRIDRLGAGITIGESLWQRRFVVSYVELSGLNLTLRRDSASAPLNIQPILDRFKPKQPGRQSHFDLAINLLVIRKSGVSYDVETAPAKPEGTFDPNHISVTGLRADILAPVISDQLIDVDIKRLAASERSGLILEELAAAVRIDTAGMAVRGFNLRMPDSRLALADLEAASPLAPGFNPLTALRSPLATLSDTYVTLSDLSPFARELHDVDARIDIEFDLEGRADSIAVSRFRVVDEADDVYLSLHGNVRGLDKGIEEIEIDLKRVNVDLSVPDLLHACGRTSPLRKLATDMAPLAHLGRINLLGDLSASAHNLDFDGALSTACGNLDMDCGVIFPPGGPKLMVDGLIQSQGFSPAPLSPALAHVGHVAFTARADLSVKRNRQVEGTAEVLINELMWDHWLYTDIVASARASKGYAEARLESFCPLLSLTVEGGAALEGEMPITELFAQVRKIDLSPFRLPGALKGGALEFNLDTRLHGRNPDTFRGWANVTGFTFHTSEGKKLAYDELRIEADGDSVGGERSFRLRSPLADADLKGRFSFKTLVPQFKAIIAGTYPSLFPDAPEAVDGAIDMTLDMTLRDDTVLTRFLQLPVELIHPATLGAFAHSGHKAIGLTLDAPYLSNKGKLIRNTRLAAAVDGLASTASLTGHTAFPTKNGQLDLNINADGLTDSLLTDIGWTVERDSEFRGNIDIGASFSRDTTDLNALLTHLSILPSRMVFNDTVWTVNPGNVSIAPGEITVHHINGGRPGQHLSIDGIASADSTSLLTVKLENIDLDYVFETLAIGDAVQFGGRATGNFYGRQLLSSDPVLYTPRLQVQGLKYNHCVMGDADIHSSWNHAAKAVMINAVIKQANGRKSLIDGSITPSPGSLDFEFDADRAPVGFMLPFMSAFATKLTGEVSGKAHLFGTFKDLDLTGDVYASNLGMTLGFTGCTYTTSDSVSLKPGRIEFSDVTLSDPYGKTASLSGFVTHNYFHDPEFRFVVRDARDLLVYDIGENDTQDPWYGRIFAGGSASVNGVPGRVNIDVDMITAPRSIFTFVLSDSENAVDYNFITLRDADRARKDSIAALDPTPERVLRLLRNANAATQDNTPSDYNMNLQIGITKQATLELVMDPQGGDKITANGSGHIAMEYNSDGELKMLGDYTITEGTYNFTLQDIIIKEFKIREGSRITFLGDPYAAQLDITATHSVKNANLADLDESFLEDKDLKRTKLTVDALLHVSGDMRQPSISFDLEFPATLARDVDRKVRSIISTEEMMSRQIIYLLALNKFYTPDYMNNSATHTHDLMSVASSTLSSRLGAMLGELSPNWSISPAIRSDRGDFSDVEVDVALSSHLLNNRLLFNGNFGYRDKSLNNNSFIGDFDIRYLLNRSGSMQLKAYNRYNDQNYYLKSALTTQGVGIVFKRDFDSILSFLRPFLKKKNGDEK